jgi:hypothetical protein
MIFISLLLASFCASRAPKWAKAVFATFGLASTLSGGAAVLYLKETRVGRVARKEVNKERVLQQELSRLPQQQGGCPPAIAPQDCGCDESGWVPSQDQQPGILLYNWDDLEDEAVGIVIAGQSGSGKTSAATWVLGMLTRNEPAVIKVCDPHYNDIWEEIGLAPIGEFSEIQAELEWLVAELDRRRIRKKNKQPLGENLIVVADEIGACIESFDDPKVITTALKRIGSEGRKFGITLIAIDQSPNSDDLGISAKKRDNYLMIGLCSVAIALAKQDYKNSDPMMQFLSLQAYPCVVKLGGILTPAIHPTHGSYTKFKKKGNPPQNLMHINQLAPEPKIHTEDVKQRLESLWGMDCTDAHAHGEPGKICPRCHSANVRTNGVTTAGTPRYRCNDCDKTWSIK